MSRLRISKRFGKRSTTSLSLDPKITYWLIFEGSKTEIDYFEGIENNRKELNIYDLVELKILERRPGDGKSHPKHLVDGAIEALEKETIELDDGDEIWLIFDRDCNNVKKYQYEKIIEICKEKSFQIAITNPTFEFWLLLHFKNIRENYDEKKLLENEKSGKRRFLERVLSDKAKGYNKKKLNFEKFKKSIPLAISQSKDFETNPQELENKLGTSIVDLIEKLFSI